MNAFREAGHLADAARMADGVESWPGGTEADFCGVGFGPGLRVLLVRTYIDSFAEGLGDPGAGRGTSS
ncbi:hypothetical protein [Streptomyces acidiscabies]|uniref:hypothetical protein n=1 Tax=Streptomyces acidiscabies TaxID=42234 RepID=UPI0038F6AA1B